MNENITCVTPRSSVAVSTHMLPIAPPRIFNQDIHASLSSVQPFCSSASPVGAMQMGEETFSPRTYVVVSTLLTSRRMRGRRRRRLKAALRFGNRVDIGVERIMSPTRNRWEDGGWGWSTTCPPCRYVATDENGSREKNLCER